MCSFARVVDVKCLCTMCSFTVLSVFCVDVLCDLVQSARACKLQELGEPLRAQIGNARNLHKGRLASMNLACSVLVYVRLECRPVMFMCYVLV